MTDPFEEGREKLLRIRIKLKPDTSPAAVASPAPPSPTPVIPTPSLEGIPVKATVANFVGVLVKRVVTLAAGYAVAKGLVSATLAVELGAQAELALTAVVLTAVYAVYDKYLKDAVAKLFGADAA